MPVYSRKKKEYRLENNRKIEKETKYVLYMRKRKKRVCRTCGNKTDTKKHIKKVIN